MRETGFKPQGEVEKAGLSIVDRERSVMDRLRGRARILGFVLISLTEACATVSASGGLETETLPVRAETEQESERVRTRRVLSQEEAPHEGNYDIIIDSEDVLRVMEEQGLRIGIHRWGSVPVSEGLINQRDEMVNVFDSFARGQMLPPREVTMTTENVGGEAILIVTIKDGFGREKVTKMRNGEPDSVIVR